MAMKLLIKEIKTIVESVIMPFHLTLTKRIAVTPDRKINATMLGRKLIKPIPSKKNISLELVHLSGLNRLQSK
jgi:hypothetical protein